jgi:hypothetical protein
MNRNQNRAIRVDAATVRDVQSLARTFGLRLDARESAVLARQLEYIKARTYDVKYAALKARSFIPPSSDAPSGADSITYRQWDMMGMAKVIANYADDLPMVNAFCKEFTTPVKSIADGFQYSIQDLRAVAMSGQKLDTARAAAARRVMEQAVDEVAAFGLPEAGMPGFLNHPNIPIVSVITGTWATATAIQILGDMYELSSSIHIATKETFSADTLLLDSVSFKRVASTPASSTIPDKTILQVFLDTDPYIKNVDQWLKLDTANAAGTGPRIMAYARDPEVVQLEIPQEFEQFPPQARNLAFVIACHLRIGGTVVRYPLALAYMDGI